MSVAKLLASPARAAVVDALMEGRPLTAGELSRICPATPVRSLRQSNADRSLRLARLCCDHVAGALGVALLDRMRRADWLASGAGRDFEVTEPGTKALAEIGVDLQRCRQARRHLARSCLD